MVEFGNVKEEGMDRVMSSVNERYQQMMDHVPHWDSVTLF